MRSRNVPDTFGGIFDVDRKELEIGELESRMGEQGFWDNQAVAQKTTAQLSRLKQSISRVKDFQNRLDDLHVMLELVDESDSGTENTEYLREIVDTSEALHAEIDSLEISSFLSGPHDACNAIVSIHAGAGGTEACDWADMLLRMYLRWAERSDYRCVVQEFQPGEEAGISRVTFSIEGENAYGYAKAERGVHRLVRISPFDANKRRHTSFCAVDVIAEVKDDIDLDIDESDLRVDTYRSSGKGGQHVNKTDSAVRLTHLPTGIVVACQNERSQHKNKATAMKVLKSRIFERLADDKRAEMEKFYGEKNEIGWGHQIRSYVFQPYQMVKDLRTGAETSNVQQVMDGDIDRFIHAWLRAGCPLSRSKGISPDD
jgi:peptide chain release factor 2